MMDIIPLCLTGFIGFVACAVVMFLSKRTQKHNEQEVDRARIERHVIHVGDRVRIITPQQVSGVGGDDVHMFPYLQKFGGRVGTARYKTGSDPLWMKMRVEFENDEYGLFDDYQMQKLENL